MADSVLLFRSGIFWCTSAWSV